jgi:ABC-type Na+ efflux pump permease subunit
VIGTIGTLGTLVRLTWQRLIRGKALWLGVGIAALPALYGSIASDRRASPESVRDGVYVIAVLLLVILPAMFVATSIGEDIEDRTATYLWSRPLSRTTVLLGKLAALSPLVIALCLGGWIGAIELALHEVPPAASVVALTCGALAICCVAAGIATLSPKHGMAITIAYMMLDGVIAEIPAQIRVLSITRQVADITDGRAGAGSYAAIVVIAALWLAIGLTRIRRLQL